MSPVEWYYARGNKQMGPVSSTELKRLAGGGEIHADDLVWREGLTEWTPARNVRGLFEEEGKPAGVEEASSKPVVALSKGVKSETPTKQPAAPQGQARHLGDVLLDSLRPTFNARFVEATASLARKCGLYGLLAAMALSAAYTLIVATKGNALGHVLSGAVLVVLLAALHYVAGKSCDALDRLNGAIAGSLASTALPNCIAMLSLAAGLAALLGSAAMAVESSDYAAILPGIAVLIVWGYLAFVTLNPATLNVTIVPTEINVGAETIGVLTFLMKAMLKLAPVAFGGGRGLRHADDGLRLLPGVFWRARSGWRGWSVVVHGRYDRRNSPLRLDRLGVLALGRLSAVPVVLAPARSLPRDAELAGQPRQAGGERFRPAFVIY